MIALMVTVYASILRHVRCLIIWLFIFMVILNL